MLFAVTYKTVLDIEIALPHLCYSKTFSEATKSYVYQESRGGHPIGRSSVVVGDIAYVQFGGPNKLIDSSATVTKVTASNIYVSQMTMARVNEPVFKVKGQITWQSSDPTMVLRFMNTSMER
jgi:hypothetical protein